MGSGVSACSKLLKFEEKCLKPFVVVQTICSRHGNMLLSWKRCNNYTCVPSFISIRATIRKFETCKSQERWLRLFVKHVLLLFWCWWLNTLCIQSFVHIALTICELHWHMCTIYNVLPGLFTVNNIKYGHAHPFIDTYIPTKFHGFIFIYFLVMHV